MKSITAEQRNHMLLCDPVSRVIPKLAVPTIISMLITNIYNMADTFFVSQIGTSASGAVGVIFSAMAIIQAVSFMIGMGAGTHVSQALGAGNREKADAYASTSFFTAFIAGVILAFFSLTNIDAVVRFLCSTETIAPYAKDYATYIFSAMPFMIVGSFLLVFAYPPFSPDTTWGFARAWLDLAKEFEGRILTPFDMTMGIMSIYICAAIAYNLGKHYEKTDQLDPFMCAMLSIMAFLLVAAPKTNGNLPVDSLGGTGIFTAILVAVYCVEMMRFLKAHNIGIRLPDQVPPMIKNSFDLLIPVLVVVLTLYPLSLLIQHHFDMLIPQAIMAIFKPLVSAADSLPAILLAVLVGHLLWFAGIHGAAIVSGMLQMFWLTNLGMNQQALAQGAPLPHIFMEAFWTFFIVIGGSGATMGLVFCYLRSRSAHLRSIGRLSVVPSLFNINEPVIFGTPIVILFTELANEFQQEN